MRGPLSFSNAPFRAHKHPSGSLPKNLALCQTLTFVRARDAWLTAPDALTKFHVGGAHLPCGYAGPLGIFMRRLRRVPLSMARGKRVTLPDQSSCAIRCSDLSWHLMICSFCVYLLIVASQVCDLILVIIPGVFVALWPAAPCQPQTIHVGCGAMVNLSGELSYWIFRVNARHTTAMTENMSFGFQRNSLEDK